MRSILLCFLPALIDFVASSSTCDNANNCLRAVRSSGALASHSADCASYLKTTVTPTTIYQTLTISVTPTSTVPATTTTEILESVTITTQSTLLETSITTTGTTSTTVISQVLTILGKRAATSKIPSYASACSNAAAYSSACSCIGVTPTTTTAAAPETSVTLSSTTTPSTRTVSTTLQTVSTTSTITVSTAISVMTEVIESTATSFAIATASVTVSTTAIPVAGGNCGSVYTATVGQYSQAYFRNCDSLCFEYGGSAPDGATIAYSFEDCIDYCFSNDVLHNNLAQYDYETGACVCTVSYAGVTCGYNDYGYDSGIGFGVESAG
ncbi:hypothetical protein BR93DRAFT_968445 [Coniochaeta sp. PMI_546]|nr:hypothetical protein BR93DRAFT_968445 [Coniochaeta sp. PMI_546]